MGSTVIINNTALRNNGDVAIVMSLAKALADANHEVIVATAHKGLVRREYPFLNTCPDVVGYWLRVSRSRIISGLFALGMLLLNKDYRRANALIGAPGGYINRYYEFGWKLEIYKWAKRLGKRTIIYAQSIGPLREDQASHLRRASTYIDLIVTRDEYSFKTALDAGVAPSRLRRTPDAIFLRSSTQRERGRQKGVAAISVREWRYDCRSKSKYVALIRALVDVLLTDGYRIHFISTCQGVPGYADDSKLAVEVAGEYGEQCKTGAVAVSREYLNALDLEDRLASFDLVIGTRLHICLLALVNGVPALNISYEAKGREAYGYLGYPQYSIDYNEPVASGVAALVDFMQNRDAIEEQLPGVIAGLHSKAEQNLQEILKDYL